MRSFYDPTTVVTRSGNMHFGALRLVENDVIMMRGVSLECINWLWRFQVLTTKKLLGQKQWFVTGVMILVGIFVTSDDERAVPAFLLLPLAKFMNAYFGPDLIIQNQNDYWYGRRHFRAK